MRAIAASLEPHALEKWRWQSLESDAVDGEKLLEIGLEAAGRLGWFDAQHACGTPLRFYLRRNEQIGHFPVGCVVKTQVARTVGRDGSAALCRRDVRNMKWLRAREERGIERQSIRSRATGNNWALQSLCGEGQRGTDT
jgi:hypothetical protein